MKNVFLFLIPICISLSVPGQKDFEGIIVYRNSISSNIDGISNAAWKKIFALSEIDTVTIKKGNFKQSSPRKDVYYIAEKQKVFFRYKGIDTLYFLDYSEDTATVISVNKTGDKKKIAGYDCNAITIQTSESTTRYFYSPAIYTNPAYNQNNRINQFNVFAKETASLFLGAEQQTETYTLKATCLRVQETPV